MLSIAVLAAMTASAQVEIGKISQQIGLSILPTTGDATKAAEALQILESDLKRCGWFGIVTTNAAEATVQSRVEKVGGGFTLDGWVHKRDKTQLHARRYQGDDLRKLVHQLADDVVAKVAKQKGIAQTQIAFISKKSGATEIWTMDYDGHNARQLTNDKALCAHPRWSADGRRIAFTSYRNVFPDVYVMDVASRGLRRVAAFPGLNTGGAFAPDGQLAVVLSKDGNPELYTMGGDGSNPRRLTRTRGEEASPSWSPDGRRIVYSSAESGTPQLWVMGREGGGAERLATGRTYCTEPDWSPSGNVIAFVGRLGRFQLFVLDLQTREVRQVTDFAEDCTDPSWAPDGRHLVFARGRSGQRELYVLDAVNGQAVKVSSNLGDCVEPTWSR